MSNDTTTKTTDTTQQTFNHLARDTDANTGTQSLEDILADDEAVDELTDIQAIDAWVRGQFAHTILRGKGPRYMHTQEFRDIEKFLKDARGSALKQVAIIAAGRHSDLAQALGWENGPGNARTLFNRWTTADNPDIETVRGQLKSGLRGCGMARIEIYRHRVKHHTRNSGELTESDQ